MFMQLRYSNGRYANHTHTKRIKALGKFMIISLVVLWALALLKVQSNRPAIQYSAIVPEVMAATIEADPPVLERIAKCESGASHVDKNGQVLINATRDVGYYQINVAIHGKKATEMGLNLFIEEDNKKFAEYLYENFGTEPWVHSKKCWNK